MQKRGQGGEPRKEGRKGRREEGRKGGREERGETGKLKGAKLSALSISCFTKHVLYILVFKGFM